MSVAAISPKEQRQLAARVGKDLGRHYGRKRFYLTYEVIATMRRLGYARDRDSWALSLYVSPYDFGIYHSVRGENCDYADMHWAMRSSIEQEKVRKSVDRRAEDTDWSVLDLFDWFDTWDWPDFSD